VASIVLLDLMGGVALLLWGLHMVRSGIMRAFGSGLRRFLGTALQNRFLALLVGVGVTALLQSSTATGLLAAVFILLLDGIARLLAWLLPEQAKQADPSVPLYLDEAAIQTPPVALACAARETLHMGDVIEAMLKQAMTALLSNDRKLVVEVSRMDNIIDRLDEAIKLYVTKLTRESLDEREGARAMEIIAFAINLEHIGDIIDKNLMELADKKIKHKYEFSKEGAAELEAFHKRILENLKFAFSVFMNQDVPIARKLIEEKTQLRTAELRSADSHLARLREGRPESIETSSLHLDILRDLKRIYSHICSVAYPVLEAAGELHPNRLKDSDAPELSTLLRGPS
jgi:phosphate:Na+ symporter